MIFNFRLLYFRFRYLQKFLLCFLLFWLLTINHAAMRLAAPAFVYALSILKVIHEKTPVYRQ